jgi:hypothetical protein
VDGSVLDTILVDLDAEAAVRDAFQWAWQKRHARTVMRHLRTHRNVDLESIVDGAWLLIGDQPDDLQLVIVLNSSESYMRWRCWFGDNRVEYVDAVKIWAHLTQYYPAPLTRTGAKTVLPKAQQTFKLIEASLANTPPVRRDELAQPPGDG